MKVHIGRLVLDGVPAQDAPAVTAAFEAELRRLLSPPTARPIRPVATGSTEDIGRRMPPSVHARLEQS